MPDTESLEFFTQFEESDEDDEPSHESHTATTTPTHRFVTPANSSSRQRHHYNYKPAPHQGTHIYASPRSNYQQEGQTPSQNHPHKEKTHNRKYPQYEIGSKYEQEPEPEHDTIHIRYNPKPKPSPQAHQGQHREQGNHHYNNAYKIQNTPANSSNNKHHRRSRSLSIHITPTNHSKDQEDCSNNPNSKTHQIKNTNGAHLKQKHNMMMAPCNTSWGPTYSPPSHSCSNYSNMDLRSRCKDYCRTDDNQPRSRNCPVYQPSHRKSDNNNPHLNNTNSNHEPITSAESSSSSQSPNEKNFSPDKLMENLSQDRQIAKDNLGRFNKVQGNNIISSISPYYSTVESTSEHDDNVKDDEDGSDGSTTDQEKEQPGEPYSDRDNSGQQQQKPKTNFKKSDTTDHESGAAEDGETAPSESDQVNKIQSEESGESQNQTVAPSFNFTHRKNSAHQEEMIQNTSRLRQNQTTISEKQPFSGQHHRRHSLVDSHTPEIDWGRQYSRENRTDRETRNRRGSNIPYTSPQNIMTTIKADGDEDEDQLPTDADNIVISTRPTPNLLSPNKSEALLNTTSATDHQPQINFTSVHKLPKPNKTKQTETTHGHKVKRCQRRKPKKPKIHHHSKKCKDKSRAAAGVPPPLPNLFPFCKTPSGNFKIGKDMIAFESKQVAVLVDDRTRTRIAFKQDRGEYCPHNFPPPIPPPPIPPICISNNYDDDDYDDLRPKPKKCSRPRPCPGSNAHETIPSPGRHCSSRIKDRLQKNDEERNHCQQRYYPCGVAHQYQYQDENQMNRHSAKTNAPITNTRDHCKQKHTKQHIKDRTHTNIINHDQHGHSHKHRSYSRKKCPTATTGPSSPGGISHHPNKKQHRQQQQQQGRKNRNPHHSDKCSDPEAQIQHQHDCDSQQNQSQLLCWGESDTENQCHNVDDFIESLHYRLRRAIHPDMKIIIDNKEFPCHSIALAAYSKYFDCLKRPREAVQHVILPKDHVSPEDFPNLMDWILLDDECKPMVVSQENVLSLYVSAQYLGIPALKEHCLSFINDKIHTGDQYILQLYEEACKKPACKGLLTKLAAKLTELFPMIYKSRQFLTLCADDLIVLIDSDCVKIKSELQIYDTAVRWLLFDWENRYDFAVKVMNCVRFGLLTPLQLTQIQHCSEATNMPDYHCIFSIRDINDMLQDGLTYSIFRENYKHRPAEFNKWIECSHVCAPRPRLNLDDSSDVFDLPSKSSLTSCRSYCFEPCHSQQQDDKPLISHSHKIKAKSKTIPFEFSTSPCHKCDSNTPVRDSPRRNSKNLNDHNNHNDHTPHKNRTPSLSPSPSPRRSSDHGGSSHKERHSNTPPPPPLPEMSQSQRHSQSERRRSSSISKSTPKPAERESKQKEESSAESELGPQPDLPKPPSKSPHKNSNDHTRASLSPPISGVKSETFELNNETEETEPTTSNNEEKVLDPKQDKEAAATKIQANFRGYFSRKKLKAAKTAEDLLKDTEAEFQKLQSAQLEKEQEQKMERKASAALEKLTSPNYSKSLLIPGREVILVFGGMNPQEEYNNDSEDESYNNNNCAHIYRFNPEENLWENVGEMPEPRSHCGVVRVKDLIYIFGGTDPRRFTPHGKPLPTSTCWSFNPQTLQWSIQSKMKTARTNFGFCSYRGKIYVFGGKGTKGISLSSCERFDPQGQGRSQNQGVWEHVAPMQISCMSMAVSPLGDKIYIVGGVNAATMLKTDKRPIIKTVQTYNPKMNEWSYETPLRSGICYSQTLSMSITDHNSRRSSSSSRNNTNNNNRQLFLLGGAGKTDKTDESARSLKDVLIYEDGEWEQVGTLKKARHGHCMVKMGKHLVIMGGVSSDTAEPLDTVEIYNTETNRASARVAVMPQKLTGMAAVVF